MIAAGVDVRTLSGHLGHADSSVTLRVYSHAIEAKDKVTAAIPGQIVGGPPALDRPVAVERLEPGT